MVLLVGVEAVGGLVHDEHGGIVQDGLGQADAALVALGQRLDALAEHAFEARSVDRRCDPRLRLAAPSKPRISAMKSRKPWGVMSP